jgi:hypothetical protein
MKLITSVWINQFSYILWGVIKKKSKRKKRKWGQSSEGQRILGGGTEFVCFLSSRAVLTRPPAEYAYVGETIRDWKVEGFMKEFEEDVYCSQWEFWRQLREECIRVKFVFNIGGVEYIRVKFNVSIGRAASKA